MFGQIEHIGIAVKDLDNAEKLYTKLLGTAPYKREAVLSEKVITSFFMAGSNKIELLQGTDPSSPISKFIEKRGEGIHHIAYRVEDIAQEIARLKEVGFDILNDPPKRGADNKWVTFIHPRDTGGTLTELCMERVD
jgi:methylmalonyl-CoA/ethylmalonyl-CoA epimerase